MKMLVLLKTHLNYQKNDIFECLFKKYNNLLFFKKTLLFIISNGLKEKT